MKSWLIIGLTLTFLFMASFSLAEKSGASETLKLPIYPEMHLVWQSSLKKGIIVKEFCSNKPANEVIKYYKSSLKSFTEIEMGTAKGSSTKLLLDVDSPGKWRKSKEFIEILKPKKKKSKCKTTIYISSKHIAREKEKREQVEIPRLLGFGGFVNTVNFSGGPTLIFWPTKNFALQGTYGVGTFTSYEARALFRLNVDSKIKPYLGAGYIHAEKDETVLGVDITIEGDSYSAFAGAEVKLTNSLYAYLEVSGTPIEVETEFISGSTLVKASVEYSAVTINAALVFYLW